MKRPWLLSGAFFIFTACVADSVAIPAKEVPETVPMLVSASYSCDPMAARWSFSAEADAWTGNGQVAMTTDGRYLELHALDSKSAASDGSSDSLALSLTVVADWRDVTLGSSTFFNCEEPGLGGLIRIFEQDGKTEADCRFFGENKWAEWNVGLHCDKEIETE